MPDPIRVLFVDDADSPDRAAKALEGIEGALRVITAASIQEGLEILDREDVDCIVSEYRLSGTDGLSFLDAVRGHYPELPFLLFTGDGSERVASEAISVGVTDYLRKDGEKSYERLADRIREVVSASGSGDHARKKPLDRITDAFYALDTDWRFTYVNEAAEEMLRRPAEELIGERFWDLYPEATETPFYDHYVEALEEGEPRTIEQYYEPTGLWFREHIYPSESGISVVSHDITEPKQGQQQVERTQVGLGEFTAEVGPTLRESLGELADRLETVQSETDSEHAEVAVEEFDQVETAASYLLTLAECTEPALDLCPVELPSMVHQVWAEIETGEATLRIDTGRSIEADRTQLERLLRILLHNAVEHGSATASRDGPGASEPPGAVTVTVGETEDGFYVADDGPGIPAGDREKVFEPGYSTVEDGNGLGLSVAQQVANVHGWNLRVTDSDDGGARFEVSGVDLEP